MMNESLDLGSLRTGQFAVVIDEISTGIVLNTDTLERCRDGKSDFVVAQSYEAAVEIAKSLLARSSDIEAMIFNSDGDYVKHVRL
ncbi:hypothetical protein [Rhodopirellula sp. P2]|uniref:hypothetical protein n=1 Tax=Rhodopirellula sp. P2 TaxID=2127060 RepID=UPI002367A875|nr:hypothetical protein [Rhodopirellula sp. P2]WDQ16502.1 hypothetical protein PSR62_23195 [Rhodopirellula sp. P2]